jgi:integrase
MSRREANRKKLTDALVARIKTPATGNIIVWDALLPGLGLRVSSTGRRVWIVALRRPGKEHPVRLRLEPQPTTLAVARAAARLMLAGGPPAPVLFGDLVEQFLEHGRTGKGRPWRPETLRIYRNVLRGAALPLHDRPVAEIRRREIAALTSALAQKDGSMAALTRGVLSRFWNWLAEHDDDILNPVPATPRYGIPHRSRVLSGDELRRLWRATAEPVEFHLALRIALWTGCRRAEAGGIRASELSPDGTLWTVSSTRTKNGVELELPIARQMQEALAAWPRRADRDLLFGQTSSAGLTGWDGHVTRLNARLRFNRPFTAHDCRRTTETGLAEIGTPKDIANRVLNHAVPTITKSYDFHSYREEKARALQAWADRLDRLAG